MTTFDFLFKNKEYGAYQLRKEHTKNILKGLFVTVLLSSTFLFSFKKTTAVKPLIYTDVILSSVTVKENKTIIKPQINSIKQQRIKSTKFTTPVIKKEITDAPVIDEIIGVVSTKDVKDSVEIIQKDGEDIVQEQEKTEKIEEKEEIIKEEAIEEADEKAKFSGNWNKYVERNLNINIPINNGAPEGLYSVIVIFIVDKDGNISSIEVENDPGYGIKEEAIRVIKKSPKWLPGKKHGKNVKSYHKQKITFIISN